MTPTVGSQRDTGLRAAPAPTGELEAVRELWRQKIFECPPRFLKVALSIPERVPLCREDIGIVDFVESCYGKDFRNPPAPDPIPDYVLKASEARAIAAAVHTDADATLYRYLGEYDELTGAGSVSLLGGKLDVVMGSPRPRPGPAPDAATVRRLLRLLEDSAAARERARQDLERAHSDWTDAQLRAQRMRTPEPEFHHGAKVVAEHVAKARQI